MACGRNLVCSACGRCYTWHWAIVVLEILLSDIPRAVFGLHPIAEVLLHVVLLERLSVIVCGEEALASVFPRVILKERPLRVASKALVLLELDGRLEEDDRQTTRLLPRLVPPRQPWLLTSVVLDLVEEFEEAHAPDLLLWRLLPRQIGGRLRAPGKPVACSPLVELNVRDCVHPLAFTPPLGPVLSAIVLLCLAGLCPARQRKHLSIQMDALHSARDEELRNALRVVCDLRLAHFLPDFRHERFVQLATELGVLPVFALLFPAGLVLEIHVVDDVVQRAPGTAVLVMLRAIFGAVHLRLLLRGNGLCVGVALIAETHCGDVVVHVWAVSTQVATPQVRPQCILSNGLVARLAHHILRVAVATVPHVAGTFQKPRARLRRIGRAEGVWMVEIVHVL